MSDEDYEREGWRPSWKPNPAPTVSTHHLSHLPDRDDLADLSYDFIATPVETETGEAMRLEGMRVLETRIETLRSRQAKQQLTSIEVRELLDSQAASHTLERMAPAGALLPARDRELV
jgi:hypothetical protein